MTSAGKDVARALAGWPKCPLCGRWMEARPPIETVGRPAWWKCDQSDHTTRFIPGYGWEKRREIPIPKERGGVSAWDSIDAPTPQLSAEDAPPEEPEGNPRGYLQARGAIQLSEPAEVVIRRLRDEGT